VTTFIGSGNVVFKTSAKSAKVLEKRIEKGLRRTLGYEVEAFVRTDTELAKIANCRPFRQSEADGRDFNIILLGDALGKSLRCKLMALNTDADEFSVREREIYWLRRKKRSGVGFSSVPLEETLCVPFTIRGGKTIKKMALKYACNVARMGSTDKSR
jgi:uncharacterized protein (DUF1697 family)